MVGHSPTCEYMSTFAWEVVCQKFCRDDRGINCSGFIKVDAKHLCQSPRVIRVPNREAGKLFKEVFTDRCDSLQFILCNTSGSPGHRSALLVAYAILPLLVQSRRIILTMCASLYRVVSCSAIARFTRPINPPTCCSISALVSCIFTSDRLCATSFRSLA